MLIMSAGKAQLDLVHMNLVQLKGIRIAAVFDPTRVIIMPLLQNGSTAQSACHKGAADLVHIILSNQKELGWLWL
jgi:hypothetical protein